MFDTKTGCPTSGGPPVLQSNERQKEDDPNPGVAPELAGTSRELRWLKLLGQVEIRERDLTPAVGVADDRDLQDAAEVMFTSLFMAPLLLFLAVSAVPRIEFIPGAKFKLRLRCRLMLKSSPVVEGRLPRLIEFLVAFFPRALRLTLAEFPSRDLQGVALPPSWVEGVLWLSKADRDWVEP